MPDVFVASKRCLALPIALVTAVALGGCANINFDTTGSWFSKPLDVFGTRGAYTYANLGDARQERPITANDLIDANGSCPGLAASTPTPTQAIQDNAGASASVSPDTASLLGGGIGIGMSECDVVARLGQPTAVNLGRNSNGERSAILTFQGGQRPGIYRFEAGRLMEMDRVQEPPAPAEPAKKKVAKKKPMKPKEPASNGGQT